MTSAVSNRDLDEVFDSPLWPSAGLAPADPRTDRRHMALANVLLRIPDSGYKKLCALADTFSWFVPVYGAGGMVQAFPVAEAKVGGGSQAVVLFLCPSLELRGFDVIVATTAHELAHLALGHNLSNAPDQYDAQEEEAWRLIREWGFDAEERKHVLFHRRMAQREMALKQKLLSSA